MYSSPDTTLDDIREDELAPQKPEAGRKLVWLGKGFLALVDQGLLSGSNFLIGILLARWLTREEYGAYALGFSVFLLLSGFHNAFFLEPMSVLGPESFPCRLTAYIKKLLGFHFVLAFVLSALAAVGVFFLRFFASGPALSAALWGVVIAVPVVLFHWLCRRAVYLRLAPGLAAVTSAAYSAAMILLLLVFKREGWLSPFTGFLVQSLAVIPAILMLLASLRHRGGFEGQVSNTEVVQQHWRYGRWVVGCTIVNWLSANGYYVIVAALLPLQELAALRALRNFTLPFTQALVAINLLVLPWASGRFGEEGGAGLRRRTRQLTWLFGGGALIYLAGLWVFGGRVMGFVYAGRYNDFSHLLLLATIPLFFVAAATGSEVACQVLQAPSEVFLSYGVSGAITVLLGVPFTRYWGLTGGLVALLISGLAFWGVMTYRSRQRLRSVAPEQENAGYRAVRAGRVVWLMPDLRGAYYWQPIFKEFTSLLPETRILAGNWPGTLPAYAGTFDVHAVPGVKFVTLARGKSGYPKGFTLAHPTLLWRLPRFRPQVILTSGLNLWSAYALLFKLFTRCRVVLLWEGISPSIAGLNEPLRLAVRRQMAKMFDAAITNTRAGAQYLVEVLWMSPAKIVCHPFEVADAGALGAVRRELPVVRRDGPFKFLVVAQLIERKGIHRLFQAARLLRDRGLNGFTLEIAGTGELDQKLRQVAAESGLGGVVQWLGRVDYEELARHYRACDALVLPTLEDTWGMVVLEAMCLGKPIVCSKYAGASELIEDGENGFVVDPHNPSELADRMELLMRVPELPRKMGEKSKEIIRPYTPRRAAEVLAGIAIGNRTPNSGDAKIAARSRFVL